MRLCGRSDLIREYLSYCRVEKGLAANSVQSYERDLAKLSEVDGENGLKLMCLTRQDLREWLIDLGQTSLSETSEYVSHHSLRSFISF